MTTGEKIAKLRRDNNLTQEQLAQTLGVSRQAIFKWEADGAFPETDKLIKMSEIFKCSVDYLLKYHVDEGSSPKQSKRLFNKRFFYEYKSKRMVGSLPLVHINFGIGRTAKGVIAIGFNAKGILTLGLFSLGIFSSGLFSLGLISFGVFALGILSLGTIAIGAFALGAIAIGLLAMGAIAIGEFAVGALAVAKYVAIGDYAYGMIAIGKTFANGEVYSYINNLNNSINKEDALALMQSHIPNYWQFIVNLIIRFI